MNILDKGTRVMSQNPHFSDLKNPQLYKKNFFFFLKMTYSNLIYVFLIAT